METQVLKPLAKSYLKANKDTLAAGTVKSITLSSGVMEFSKIETSQTFTGATLQYPDTVLL